MKLTINKKEEHLGSERKLPALLSQSRFLKDF
jgi:hypothetical protein